MRAFSWTEMWVPTWPPWEVALRAALVFGFLVLALRLSGRKEVTRYSIFDIGVLFLITVAARMAIVGEDHSLTNAFVALATIFSLNFLLSWLSFRSHRAAAVLEGERFVLVERGTVHRDRLRHVRISEDELRARLRAHGIEDLSRVRRAYLEHNGQVTFVLEP